jgi:nitrogen fixation/metabolism regulation signal transduction histidine kinase
MKKPLGTILLNTEYLREQLSKTTDLPASSYSAKFETVREEVNRLNDYVKNLMKLANLQPPTLHPTDVREALNDIIRFYEKRKPDAIHIQANLAQGLPDALIDVNLFTAAIINLLDNAVKAMNGSGTLTVACSLVYISCLNSSRMLSRLQSTTLAAVYRLTMRLKYSSRFSHEAEAVPDWDLSLRKK